MFFLTFASEKECEMIRNVTLRDAEAIAGLYNEFVLHSVVTFETEAVTAAQMRERIAAIAACYPYGVYEAGGQVAGYAYAHAWRERAAYAHTWETTVYVDPRFARQGIGYGLLSWLAGECRRRGCHALVACITGGNTASCALHRKAGFRQVSRFEQVGLKFGRRLDVTDWELLLEP